jgi:hypothetical protein
LTITSGSKGKRDFTNPRQLRPLGMQDTQMSQPSAGDISQRFNQISDTKDDLKKRFGSKM